MSLNASYHQITDTELEKMMCFDDGEESQKDERSENCDIEKMWDALHFLLTGKSAGEPIKDNLISEAIVGQFHVFDEDIIEGISGIWSEKVKEIAEALQKIDFEKYIEKFNMSDFDKNDIYPNIWKCEEEVEEIKDNLRVSFKLLKEFYIKMAEKDCAVLVSIC